MAKAKKSGPVTNSELDFIRLNKDKPAEWIADEIGRNVETVLKILNQQETYGNKAGILNLEKREDWKLIKDQFSEEELSLFKERWAGLVNQFREELQYSEAMMVMLAIKQDIISNRILVDQRRIEVEVARLEKERQDEMDNDPPDSDRIKNIEFQISSYCAAQVANSRDYREGTDKLEKTIKALKGTREQRMTKVEESKQKFSTLMRRIVEDNDLKHELGSYMAKMREAMEVELKRLGKPHLYANQQVDRPFLSADTLDIEEEEEDE